MSHKSNKKHHPYCLNCHYPLSEFDKNCSQCGQKPTDGKTTLHDLMHEFVHTLFHLDGKFFWTLKHLFVPGKLTTEFFRGHHKRYAHPVQLFLVLGAFCFWLISSMSHKAEKDFADEVQNNKIAFEKKKLFKHLDSLSHTLSPQYNDAKTQIAYDSLLIVAYKNSFSEEFKVDSTLFQPDELEKNDNYKQGTESAKNATIFILPDSMSKIIDSIKIEKSGNGLWESLKIGWNLAEEKKKKKFLETRKKKNLKEYLNTIDSSRLYPVTGIRIPREEMYSVSADSLIKKYKVTGWLNKTMTIQTVKVRKEGQNYFHYIIGKLLWLTLILIPVMALLFSLLYRRQKRFYVEHFVFLLHFNVLTFATLIIAIPLIEKEIIEPIITLTLSILLLFFSLFLALKRYYHQGWIKTFIKFIIVNVMYFILGFLFLLLYMILSFIIF